MNDNVYKLFVFLLKMIAGGALIAAVGAADYFKLPHFEVVLMLVTACLSALGIHTFSPLNGVPPAETPSSPSKDQP